MPNGQGKSWSKGLTAATYTRVAKAAAAHRGLRYVRRTPLADCNWYRGGPTALPLAWSEAMGYVVGLTATDGCLVTSRPRIDFKSQDLQLVETYLGVLGRTDRIMKQRTRTGRIVFVTQVTDRDLYTWFVSVGLSPRKSLTLGRIDVPNEFLSSLARGLLDGDGTISNAVWRADTTRRSDYYYEWLRTRFVSGSRPHLEWLRERLTTCLGLRGWNRKTSK